jgi:hypothetical protein
MRFIEKPHRLGERADGVKAAIFVEESELSISDGGVSALATLALPDEKISKPPLRKRFVFASLWCIFRTSNRSKAYKSCNRRVFQSDWSMRFMSSKASMCFSARASWAASIDVFTMLRNVDVPLKNLPAARDISSQMTQVF